MSKAKYVFTFALLIPLLGAAIPAMAQTQKGTQTQGQAAPKDSAETAKRTKCFEEAQAAVQALGPSAQIAEKNERGSDVYHECALKAGIRP